MDGNTPHSLGPNSRRKPGFFSRQIARRGFSGMTMGCQRSGTVGGAAYGNCWRFGSACEQLVLVKSWHRNDGKTEWPVERNGL